MARYKRVPLKDLVVDERYQRPLDEKRVQKMADKFDDRLLGVLEISQRNAKAAVFDGQHRLAALKELARPDAPCLIHQGLSPQEEADLFIAHQSQRKSVKPLDRFKARVFAEDPVALDVLGIVEASGYGIGSKKIQAVGALERTYLRYGGHGLARALTMIAVVWGRDDKATDGAMIAGVARFVDRYEDRVHTEQLDRLREVAPVDVLRRATGKFQGGGEHWLSAAVESELLKVTGVRGRPVSQSAKRRAEMRAAQLNQTPVTA